MNYLLTSINSYLHNIYSISGAVVAMYLTVLFSISIICFWQYIIIRREKAIFLLESKLRQSYDNDLFTINETIIQKNRLITRLQNDMHLVENEMIGQTTQNNH